jgi:hypothetical protein
LCITYANAADVRLVFFAPAIASRVVEMEMFAAMELGEECFGRRFALVGLWPEHMIG